MKQKLQKEIEEAQSLGRRARRQKERQLQKEYKDSKIRIKSGKQFAKTDGISREMRRLLKSDKNLIRTVMEIIHKYLPDFIPMINKLNDKRHKSYCKYNMRAIVMTRLFALICGITSMNDMTNQFNTTEAIKNLSSICGQELKEVPHWQTIQDVIEDLDINEIQDIRKTLVNGLIKSKMFDKYRYNGCIQVIVDATGVSNHDYNLNGTCIARTRDGQTKYFKYVLEAKIVFGSIVISLESEWVENTKLNNENEKQDCEVNAFKRMAPRIRKTFPKLKFIITGDALYATAPMIEICEEYGWYYIFNLKKNRLKNVYEEFIDNVNYHNETSKENYTLSTGIIHKGHSVNAFSYVEKTEKKITAFSYISNLDVTDCNIVEIVKMGRARWKIENEGFNVQKNGTFCISHLCSRNENALKIHYLFIQIAHLIRQLLELGSIVVKSMRFETKKEISKNLTKTLTSIISNLDMLDLSFQLRFDN